jgi:hypothetical protein
MREVDIFKRWSDTQFLQMVMPALNEIFRQKSSALPADLRGIIVGLTGALPDLLHASFQEVIASGLDASACKVSCSFARARISGGRFVGSLFDTCRFKNAVFESTSFDQAKLDSPSLDDAMFRSRSFENSRIAGRGYREYGGRRMSFEKCNFRNVRFRNLQMRACSFRECLWDGAVFEKCIMVGVKFEGSKPPDGTLVDCGSS